MDERIRELESRIGERDKETPSPEVRAGHILSILLDAEKELTNWDLLCFCIEFLASQITVYEWLDKEAIIRLNSLIYTAHYFRDEIPESGVFK